MNGYKLHRRARGVLYELTPEERAQVREKLASLVAVPLAPWPAAQARSYPGDESLYLVPVNESLRAIVRAAGGEEPEVEDIVRQETLDFFAKTAAGTAK
jgi:hypothetical protein